MHIRCPHCHYPIEVVDANILSDMSCPECGSDFNLISAETASYSPGGVRTLGHFELLACLGAGRFGVVWKARDTELHRTVAIKIPRRGQLEGPEAEMFVREARAAAQVKHPGVVSVHEVSREGGTLYIVSDFIEGCSLKDWLSQQHFTLREAAELCIKVAEALHAAHEAGIVHRDLKPGNIMMDIQGEPHLTDFGLARREAGEITMTMEGQILGTPAYMSPEQAQGEGHRADRRTDIYSLGAILFELLTGGQPFRGETRMLIVQILRDEPPRPRKLNNRIPRDLETICLKCLEKDAKRRYATAADLAADLRRFLAGEPITARPVGRFGRGWRWCCRHPAVAGLLATVVFLLATVAVVGMVGYTQTARALCIAERDREYERLTVRAMECYDCSDLHGAERTIEKMFLLDPQRASGYFIRGKICRSIHDLTGAVDNYTQAVLLDPDHEESIFNRGYEYSELGQNERAIADYSRWLALTPKDRLDDLKRGVCYSNRGKCYRSLGQLDQALSDLNKAIEILSREAERRATNSQLHPGLEKYDRGIHDLWSAYIGRGLVLIDLSRGEQAEADFEKSGSLATDTVETFRTSFWRAMIALKFKGADEYRHKCRELLDKFGETKVPWMAHEIAWVCTFGADAVGDLKQCVRLAQQAVADSPERRDYVQTLGAVLYRAGDFPRAVSELERAATLGNKTGADAFGWLFLAMAHHQLNNPDQARKYLGKAVKWIDERLVQRPGEGKKTEGLPRSYRLVFQLLRREAQSLIEPKSSEPEPLAPGAAAP